MKDNISLLSSAPSGILAVLNPSKKIITKIEQNYDKICAKWLDVELNEDNITSFYETGVFTKPEVYLKLLKQISFGDKKATIPKEWVSQ